METRANYVLIGAFTLLIQLAGGEKGPPAWVRDATLYPLTAGAGKVLKTFAPEGFAAAGKIAPAVSDAVKKGAAPADALKSATGVYGRFAEAAKLIDPRHE